MLEDRASYSHLVLLEDCTKASNETDVLEDNACPSQVLTLFPLLATSPIIRVKSQLDLTEEVLGLIKQIINSIPTEQQI